MKYFEYANGDSMPLIGLGTWKSDDRAAYHAVKEAIKIGYRHFDCAARYGNEPEIGEAFAEMIAAGVVKREDLWITSKLWNNAHLQKDVQPALEQTLRDLQIDYLDLYLIHWPVALRPEIGFPQKGDEFLSLEEAPLIDTWRAMESCKEQGLSKHIGVSNFSIPKLEQLMDQGSVKPECNQVESHPMLQQLKMLSFCAEHHIAMTAYSPLGSMDRPARLKKDDEPIILEHPVVLEIAKEVACSPAQVLISWAAQRGTAVIPKSSNPQRLKQNLQAENITLSEANMKKLSLLDRGVRFVDGSIWALEGSPYNVDDLWNN